MSTTTEAREAVVVEFERIGRRRDVPSITVESTDPDVIAERVYRHAGAFLASRAFDVEVGMRADGTGDVFIDGGRFGRGTLAPVAPSALDDPELHAERYTPERLDTDLTD